jgi:SAM-dependent methyltransferase
VSADLQQSNNVAGLPHGLRRMPSIALVTMKQSNHRDLLRFIAAIRTHHIVTGSPVVRRLLASFFDADGINYQELAAVSAAELQRVPEIANLIDYATRSAISDPDRLCVLDNPLMHKLLRCTVVTDLSLERLFSTVRSSYLNWVLTDPAALTDQLPLMASLSCQCFNNEYIYSTTPIEESSLNILRRRVSEDIVARNGIRLLPEVAVYGMYRSLYSLDRHRDLLDLDGDLKEVIQRQIAEPIEEDRLKDKIRSFGSVTDPISQAVRKQYEDFPYPRWFNLTMDRTITFSEWIAREFPFLQSPELSHPEILIAGCGTGRHPLSVAFRHPESSVLAIDLSRTSLAYAMRQAERYKIANVEFLHGDLLFVCELKRTFDYIQADGVLQIMEDPAAGIKALSAVLKPGGFLRVSLYSKRAMALLLEAQRLCSAITAGDRSPEKLRQARRAMVEMIGGAGYFEFFHLSGLPDLFCPTHAKHFAPTELYSLFGELDVEFLGYPEVRKDLLALYRQRFPHDPHMRDLNSIDLFDQDFPTAFRGLQPFYLRKKAA